MRLVYRPLWCFWGECDDSWVEIAGQIVLVVNRRAVEHGYSECICVTAGTKLRLPGVVPSPQRRLVIELHPRIRAAAM